MDRAPRASRVRRYGKFVIGIAVALTTPSCVSHPGLPAPTASAYRHKVELTADAAISAVATVRLALDGERDRRTTGRYLDQVVSAQEDALDGVVGSFAAVTPPTDGATQLRDRVLDALGDAEHHVAALRIALRSGDRSGALDLRDELQSDVDALGEYGSP